MAIMFITTTTLVVIQKLNTGIFYMNLTIRLRINEGNIYIRSSDSLLNLIETSSIFYKSHLVSGL